MFGLTSRKLEASFFKSVWMGDLAKVRESLAHNLALASMQASAAVHREHPELEEGASALQLAARRGHEEIVSLLLSLHVSYEATSASGATPLHAAAMGGHAEIAAMLIAAGASADATDEHGCTPLHRAARAGRLGVMQRLLRGGASVAARDQEGSTPLLEAAHGLSFEGLRLLIGAGADLSERDALARTALHRVIIGAADAAQEGSQPVAPASLAALVEFILALGADINALDQAGETPLDLLVYLGGRNAEPKLVALFLSRGGQCVRYRKLQPKLTGAAASASGMTEGTRPSPQIAFSAAPTGAGGEGTRNPSSWGEAPIILGDRVITFGRNPECDIRYLSLTLSHRHAKIEPTPQGWVITDLGSRNGVCIDNVRVSGPHRLRPNELITLGAYEFEFDGERLVPTHGELSAEELQEEQRRAAGMRGTRG